MDRTEKREFVASLATVFAETSFVLVAQNKGLTVADVSELRRRMRAAGATYKVAKNRLATLALEGTRFDGVQPLLKGPTAIAWSTDPVAVAKTAVEFAKTNDKFVIIGGAMGDTVLDQAGVKAVASMPSREELIAQIVSCIGAPASNIAGAIGAPAANIAGILKTIEEKAAA